MKCKNCGAEFDEGIFCPECGTKVEISEETIDAKVEDLNPENVGENLSEVEAEKRKQELELEALKRKQDLELEAAKRKQDLELEAEKRRREMEIELEQKKAEAEKRRQEMEIELEQKRKEAKKLEEQKAREKAEAKAKAEAEAKARAEAEEKARAEAEEKARIKAEQAAQKKIDNEGKTMSILGLVFGIVAICTGGLFVAPEILGIIFSLKGRKQGVMWTRAKVGMILSIISIALAVAIIIWGYVSPD